MKRISYKLLKILLMILSIFFIIWGYAFLRAGFIIIGGAFILADIGIFIELSILKRLERLDRYNGR